MSRVYPRLYDRNLAYLGDLRTAKFGYKLKQTPLDTATITVPIEDAGQISMRQYVELFDDDRRVELFRVARIADKSYKQGGTCKFACDQVLCTLKDNLIPGYHEIGGVGMGLRACIEWVLARQAPTRWRLGRCDFDTYYQYSLEDSNLLVTLLSLAEPLSDYMFTTDTTQIPWVLNLVRLTDNDASELRYRRNMVQIKETVDEDGFCTRLYPYGYGEGVNKLTIADANSGVPYLDAPTQSMYGVVEMPWTDATCTDATLLKARAEALLREIQNPLTSFTVKALALSAITGEPLDRFVKGHMTRVVYTDYNIALRTRVVEIERPEVLGKPGDVTLVLSTAKADAATTIAELARKAQITELYSQGATTIDSDRLEVNADKDHPAELEFFLARDYYRVNRVLIKLKVGRYRADSRAAKGGGGTRRTTEAGGASTYTSSAGGDTTTTSTAGGASTNTSESGGACTVTVPSQTVSVGVKLSGGPVDAADGGSSNNTGLPIALTGERVTQTAEYTGRTPEGGTDASTSGAQFNGTTRANTDAAAPGTNNGGGDTSTSSAQFNGTTRANTDASSAANTGAAAPGTSSAGGDVSTSSAQFNGATRANTDASAPGTSSAGGHSHTVSGHTHTFGGSDSAGIGHNHSMTSGASNTGAISSGVKSVSISISGTTSSRAPGTTDAGGHSHTVNSHTHGMAHYHTLSTAHSHTVSSHSHTMAHVHGMAHNHTLSTLHSHTVNSHTHGMAHYHTLSTRHTHGMTHAHDFDHIHNAQHVHNISHNHTIPAQELDIPGHSHSVRIGSHSHDVTIGSHTHSVTLSAHTHTLDIPDHMHSIEYGIFEGASVDEITVAVDGKVVPAAAIVDSQVDIVPYLAKSDAGKITRETWHRVTVTPVPTSANPDGLCRITIYRHSQVFISGQAGGNF